MGARVVRAEKLCFQNRPALRGGLALQQTWRLPERRLLGNTVPPRLASASPERRCCYAAARVLIVERLCERSDEQQPRSTIDAQHKRVGGWCRDASRCPGLCCIGSKHRGCRSSDAGQRWLHQLLIPKLGNPNPFFPI